MTAFAPLSGELMAAIAALGGAVVSVVAGAWKVFERLKKAEDSMVARVDSSRADLAQLKIDVARSYVTHEAVGRLEGRIDEGFRVLREEMGQQRELLLRSLTQPRPRRTGD